MRRAPTPGASMTNPETTAPETTAIVCLDGHALNPGDLSWAPFERLGALRVYERTPSEAVVERAAQASCLLTNKTRLERRAIERLPRLRYVGVLATGYNVVDVVAARERRVAVTNVPAYGTDSVAEHVVALMLHHARPIAVHAEAVRAGRWASSPDWCFALAPISTLAGKTLGVVGLGRIGLAVARIATALDMRVVGHRLSRAEEARRLRVPVEPLELDELFSVADFVSLHCPLTEATRGLVDRRRLTLMKPHAVLINTSRGALVEEQPLAEALAAGRLGGACLDVLEEEPPRASHPLSAAPRAVLTPHIAWYAREARQRLMEMAAENLAAYLAGERLNRVD